MMMGPEPMIMIFLMSVRFGIRYLVLRLELSPERSEDLHFNYPTNDLQRRRVQGAGRTILCTVVRGHQIKELVEQVAGIVRAGRSFGMILHAENSGSERWRMPSFV